MSFEINKPDVTNFFIARALDNSVVHSGQTNTNQVTTTGMETIQSYDTENEYLNAMAAHSASYPSLPATGEQIDEGQLYMHNAGVVMARQSHTRTTDDPGDIPALFVTYRVDGDHLDWIENENVSLGTVRIYNAAYYKCIQSHVTLATWEPPNVPALWQVYIPPGAGVWTDSGETITQLYGAGVIGVTDTAPFGADMLIRINVTDATVVNIFTAGAPGILTITPHIPVIGGEIIERFI